MQNGKHLKVYNKPTWEKVALGGTAFVLAGVLLVGLNCCDPESNIDPTPIPTPSVSMNVEITPKPTVTPDVLITPIPTVVPSAEPTVEPTVIPSVEPTVEPTIEPSAEPTQKPQPTVKPTPKPTPTVEPTVQPTVEPTVEPTVTPTPDYSMYQEQARRIIGNCKDMVVTIKRNRQVILDYIKYLQDTYTSLNNDYNELSKLLEEADKLIAKNGNNRITKDLKAYRDAIQQQLDKVKEQLEATLKLTDGLTEEYKKLDITSIEQEISELEGKIEQVKTNQDVDVYRDLENRLNALLKYSQDLKIESQKQTGKEIDHTPLETGKKALDDMKDKKKEYDDRNYDYDYPYYPTPSTPTPTPSGPDIDHTYDDNGNVDDTIIVDTEEPIEEPPIDFPEDPTTVSTIANVKIYTLNYV